MSPHVDDLVMDVECAAPQPLRVPFTFAFQPIVDIRTNTTCSYEALVRGLQNEGAFHVFSKVHKSELDRFDRECRIVAIALAMKLGLPCDLNLNLLPQSLYSAKESVLSTIDAAHRHSLPLERIMLEVTEGEIIDDRERFTEFVNVYRSMGLKVAIDDFGAGYSGLNLLAEFQPDQIKLDKELICGIHSHGPRQAIVRALIQICGDLGIDLIAEGIEDAEEYSWLAREGVHLFQGYFFARPGFESLPAARFADLI